MPFYEGISVCSRSPTTLKSSHEIYKSELDCLLDIVTEPENHELKVYSHKIREERINFPELSEKVIMVQKKKPQDYDYRHSGQYMSVMHTVKYYEKNSEKFSNYEKVEWVKDDLFLGYYDIQYWVEAFMQ